MQAHAASCGNYLCTGDEQVALAVVSAGIVVVRAMQSVQPDACYAQIKILQQRT